MNRSELDDDVRLNPEQLDIEAVRQAEIFSKWAQRAVDAKAELDRLKYEYDLLESHTQMECRKDPERFGIVGNVTETAIKSCVRAVPKLAKLEDEIIKSKARVGFLEKAADAVEMKKRMIEVLVTLHGQEYFAGPSVPRDLSSAYKSYRQRTVDAVNERQGQRARKRFRPEGE